MAVDVQFFRSACWVSALPTLLMVPLLMVPAAATVVELASMDSAKVRHTALRFDLRCLTAISLCQRFTYTCFFACASALAMIDPCDGHSCPAPSSDCVQQSTCSFDPNNIGPEGFTPVCGPQAPKPDGMYGSARCESGVDYTGRSRYYPVRPSRPLEAPPRQPSDEELNQNDDLPVRDSMCPQLVAIAVIIRIDHVDERVFSPLLTAVTATATAGRNCPLIYWCLHPSLLSPPTDRCTLTCSSRSVSMSPPASSVRT